MSLVIQLAGFIFKLAYGCVGGGVEPGLGPDPRSYVHVTSFIARAQMFKRARM
jgi:hypothetical protein